MTLSSKLSALANSTRKASGLDSKLSIDEMTTIINSIGAFIDRGQLANGTDLNDVWTPGVYSIQEAKSKPIANWGALIVFKGGSRAIQLYIADIGSTYIRNGDSNHTPNPFIYDWKKLGGVVKAVLSALHLERRCLA